MQVSHHDETGQVLEATVMELLRSHQALQPVCEKMVQFLGADALGSDVVKALPDRVKKKTFLLTGLGKRELTTATAETLAQGDAAALILLGPSQSETQASIDEINSKYPKVKVIFVTMDLGSLDSVRAAAKTINSLDVPIDGIVGYPTVIAAKYATTRDGIESHLQYNYLSHFLLVNLLLGKMPEGSRVVMVSSSIRPDSPAPSFDNPGFSDGKTYHPLDGYAQSMFANVQFTKGLAASYPGRSMAAFSVNPGNTKLNLQTYISPELVASWLQNKKEAAEDLPLLLQQAPKSLAQGCSTILRALLDPVIRDRSGAFLDNNQVLALPRIDFPAGEESANQLWRISEEMVGERFRR